MTAWRGHPHTDLVKSIVQVLRAHGIPAYENTTGRAQRGGRWISFGLKVGGADIIGWLPGSGTFFAVECKTGKGRLTKEQKDFRREVLTTGAIWILARRVEDIQPIIGRAKDESR